MVRERVPIWVWVVLVSAHLLALGWSLHNGSWDFPDSGRYLQAAENLWLHGELFAQPWPEKLPEGMAMQEFTIRPLGYPLILLGLKGTATAPALVLMIQTILSLFNIGLVLRWWAHWAKPKKIMWVSAIMLTLSFPAQLIYANAVMSELALQTVVLAMTLWGIFFIKTGERKYVAGIAAMLIFAQLLKPIFYPCVFGLAGLGLALAWYHKRVDFALFATAPLVVALLYMGWNKERTGYFHFSSIAEINLLHYNAAGVVREVDGPAAEEEWVASVLQEANTQLGFAKRQQLIKDQCTRVLLAHPVVYARQHLQGMAAILLDPGRFDISQFLKLGPSGGAGLLAQARAGNLLGALQRLPWAMMIALALVLIANLTRIVLAWRGFMRLGTDEPMLRYGRWIAVGLILYVALLTGPLGAARFLVPVWPLLWGLSLVGLGSRTASGFLYADEAAPVCENQR